MDSLIPLFSASPVVPVLVIDDVDHAARLAEIFVQAGLRTAEVTLRTPAAAAAIRRMADVPGLTVGAGTVLVPDDVKRATDAGAEFLVTPATPARLVPALLGAGVPVMPGIATPTEAAERLLDGFPVLKLFPAEQYGGIGTLQAIAGPLPHARFCPTGGIGRDKVASYLALKSVVAVGGTWIAPAPLLKAGNWDTIAANARAAAAFATAPRG